MFKKSFISKLEIITTVASVRIANLTHVRIAMASPMQSGAELLLPCLYIFPKTLILEWSIPRFSREEFHVLKFLVFSFLMRKAFVALS